MYRLDENAFCLSCNLFRYKYLSECFKKVGLKPPRLFPGVVHPKSGAKGCTLGHISMIMMARSLNLPYITVYEDDAYPRPDVINKFNSIIHELDGNVEWDILSLGRNGEFSGYTGDPEKFWILYKTDSARNSLKSKVSEVTISTIDIPQNPNGSHAYVIKKSAYTEWIKILLKYPFVDIAMGSNHWEKHRILWTRELLFVQKQIDKKCMTYLGNNDTAYLYPYNYNKNCSGCCCIFKNPPIGFDPELLDENTLSKLKEGLVKK